MIDDHGRLIEYLRISLTDRCNLRCVYCMPENGVESFRHSDILRYEEILRIVRLMTELGVRNVRLTGGEPMVRRGCLDLVRMLHDIQGIETIAMTTNGLLLDGKIAEAKAAGLTSLNISIDATDPKLFSSMSRGGDVSAVKRVISDALEQRLKVKLNAVPIRGLNVEQLTALADMARKNPLDIRFIELMPLGCGAALEPVPSDEILNILEQEFGPLHSDETKHGLGPAKYYKPDGFVGSIGIISPLSHEFCDRCNRVRLTSAGYLKLCLNHTAGLDLRSLIRNGATDEELLIALKNAIAKKPGRHGFNESLEDREKMKMNRIGG